MKSFQAELHIHTVLSPCAGVEMIPPLIVQTALNHGLNLIAITDHNAGENAAAVIKAAEGQDIKVLPGMELQTKEEVHAICLFDTLEQLAELQKLVDRTLLDVPNNIEFFGEQFIVDETGEFIQRKERLLINSTELSFDDAFHHVTDLGGLFIPAHINRKAYGLIYHLGFIPPGLKIEALEISRHITVESAIEAFPEIQPYPLIQSGDVHYLDDFLGVNRFLLEEPSIQELISAFRGENGREFQLTS